MQSTPESHGGKLPLVTGKQGVSFGDRGLRNIVYCNHLKSDSRSDAYICSCTANWRCSRLGRRQLADLKILAATGTPFMRYMALVIPESVSEQNVLS